MLGDGMVEEDGEGDLWRAGCNCGGGPATSGDSGDCRVGAGVEEELHDGRVAVVEGPLERLMCGGFKWPVCVGDGRGRRGLK